MFSLGGFAWNVSGDQKAKKNIWAQDFFTTPTFAPDTVNLEVLCEFHEPNANDKLIIETDRTWRLFHTGNSEFPYRLSPSTVVPVHPKSLHLYASNDFRRLRLYYGDWKQLPESPWIYSPYEQTVMIHLCQWNGPAALMHASAICHDNKGYLFLGDSGAGKSTIAEILEQHFGQKRIFSDDRVVIRKKEGKWWVFGTPWNGTFPRSRPDGVEIGGMYFLEKSDANHAKRPSSLLPRLLPVTFGTWWLPQKMDSYFQFLTEICEQNQFPLEDLSFKKDSSAANYLEGRWS